MAGIIIPIAIHLWNVRQGKILEVGTIRFMEPSQKKRAANLRVSEWLLLLLRCLTIMLFAIVMAGPIWNKTADTNEKGWLLIAPNELKEAYQQKPQVIDSLLKNGYQLHAFETGFAGINLSDSAKKMGDDSLISAPANYWMLASELEATAPLGLDLAIVSSNQLLHFRGNKPSLARSLKWFVFYDTSIVQSPIKTKEQQSKLVDTNTFRIGLYTDQYQHDASYVAAAIQAIKDFSGRKIRVDTYKSVGAIPLEVDLLFWLSDTQIAPKIYGKTLSYQKGKLLQEQGFIYGLQQIAGDPIALYRFNEAEQKNLVTIWENGKGDPILAIDPTHEKNYLLFTHFDPAWNNLVWTNRFAEWMLPFVFSGLPLQSVADTRMIDPVQLQFSKVTTESSQKNISAANTKPITNIFWYLLLLVFVIERILSFTSKYRSHV